MFVCERRIDSIKYINVLESVSLPSFTSLWRYKLTTLSSNRITQTVTKLSAQWIGFGQMILVSWPFQSPNFNPIEHIWGLLKRKVRCYIITSKEELKNRLRLEWNAVIPKGLKITNRTKRTASRASQALVRERINYYRLAEIRTTQECEEIRQRTSKVRTAIEKVKPKQILQIISKAEQPSLEELISDKNIKILLADTVIMDVEIDNIKIQETINAGKYKEVKKDPTTSVESKVQQTLNKYKSDLP
ncbi:hypothetical protein Trydic_g21151 [Trypoxylus dichotomus]